MLGGMGVGFTLLPDSLEMNGIMGCMIGGPLIERVSGLWGGRGDKRGRGAFS